MVLSTGSNNLLNLDPMKGEERSSNQIMVCWSVMDGPVFLMKMYTLKIKFFPISLTLNTPHYDVRYKQINKKGELLTGCLSVWSATEGA